jgi:hypothetical protein
MFVASLRKSKLCTLYTALLEVRKDLYTEPATNAIYTGLRREQNVFLSGLAVTVK